MGWILLVLKVSFALFCKHAFVYMCSTTVTFLGVVTDGYVTL